MRHLLITTLLACAAGASSAYAAVEDCLVGVWDADISDIAHLMSIQMGGSARAVSGQVTMEIMPDGAVTILADDMKINVTPPNVPSMDVTVTGYSQGALDAADNVWLLSGQGYSLVGSANVLGQTMTIPFDSNTGMFGGGLGRYGCSADSLTFETGDGSGQQKMPRSWRRIR